MNMTEQSAGALLDGIALANHCQAGATAALSAALAVSLGQATANGSLAEGVKGSTAAAAHLLQSQLTPIRARLQELANSDAVAIGEFVRLRESGHALAGYAVLCDGPREMAELALKAAGDLQRYRRYVSERTHDDLEFSITLIASAARAAMQLLDSNLRIWPLPELIDRYDDAIVKLAAGIDALTPMKRIR
jgi:Formiminotransferase-cyclodeaminase